MTSYFNPCDVTVANSNHKIFLHFFDLDLCPPLWKRFCHPWAKQSPRPYGPLLLKIAPREMKHALKMHVPVCLYVLYRIRILWLYHVYYCTMFL